ncbi:MAG: hypothetical protein WC840_01355 [Candidatus Peribacteraceae bacterium]
MNRYDSFIFEGVNFRPHGKKIVLRYSLDREITFEETLMLPAEPFSLPHPIPSPDGRGATNEWGDREDIKKALFALHLIGGISYYKTCCPTKIEIVSGALSKAEVQFWDTVYLQGLGQFFFENKMDFRNRINFPASSPTRTPTLHSPRKTSKPETRNQKRILIPIGGGKDSIATIELLKKTGAHLTLLRVGPHPLVEQLAHSAGLPILNVRRSLSPALFDLNEKGALNGHVPITAYISILGILIALLYDFDAVVMSDEASASEGNVSFHGMEINHQWSKSLEFEKMLRKYIQGSIGSDIEYFSLLRPYTELKITEIFSKHPQYFHGFTSCNTNWKILSSLTPNPSPDGRGGFPSPLGGRARDEGGRWCNQCPKCASVFAALAAFLPRETLKEIFDAVLFENESLIHLYRELLGISGHKPFECVGTADETKAAFLLAMRRGDLSDTPAMKMFVTEVLPTIKDPDKLISEALAPRSDHCIPEFFQKLIVKS